MTYVLCLDEQALRTFMVPYLDFVNATKTRRSVLHLDCSGDLGLVRLKLLPHSKDLSFLSG